MTILFNGIPFQSSESAQMLISNTDLLQDVRHVHLIAASTVTAAYGDHELKSVLVDGYNICDSKPLSKYLSIFDRTFKNIRGTDFLETNLVNIKGDSRHYFLGLDEEYKIVLQAKILELNSNIHDFLIDTSHVNLQNSVEISNLLQRIQEFAPNVVWLGIGSPKQDYLAKLISNQLEVLTVAVGAAFDFLTGRKRAAPKFMQIVGLEWLFRLACEPRRLFFRYTVGNLKFIFICLNDFIKRSIDD